MCGFYTIDVKKTLLGLHDVLQSGALLNNRDSHVFTKKRDVEEPLLFHSKLEVHWADLADP